MSYNCNMLNNSNRSMEEIFYFDMEPEYLSFGQNRKQMFTLIMYFKQLKMIAILRDMLINSIVMRYNNHQNILRKQIQEI